MPWTREGVDMRRRMTTARGLSLVEVTIMLFVLMLLTGVLAPSIMDFVRDAQWVKVKEDCEAIGVSVARLARDVGPCLKFDGTGACTKTNRVDVLYSDGPDVSRATCRATRPRPTFYGGAATATDLNWHKDDSRGDSMEHQFVDNGGGPNYPSPERPEQPTAPPGRRSASAGAAPTCRRPSAPTRGDTATWSTPCFSRWRPTPERRAPPPRPRRASPCRRARLVERHLLHLARAQRPVRDRLRRERRARRLPPRRRLHLHHLGRHAVGPASSPARSATALPATNG